MESDKFEVWHNQLARTFTEELNDEQRCATLDHLIAASGANQLRFLSTKLEGLVKRDYLHLLPAELGNYLLAWLDAETLCRCCLVNKHWNKMVNDCAQAWQNACCRLRLNATEQELRLDQNGRDWKAAYRDLVLRLRQLREGFAFDSLTLRGHSARVYALHYRDGKLASGNNTSGNCNNRNQLQRLRLHTPKIQYIVLFRYSQKFEVHLIMILLVRLTLEAWVSFASFCLIPKYLQNKKNTCPSQTCSFS